MTLEEKLVDVSTPLTFFEVVPPVAGKPEALEKALDDLKKVQHLVDAVNLPEIRDEQREGQRTHRFVPRVEPRLLGTQVLRDLAMDIVINRVVVHQENQVDWFRETSEKYGIRYAVLVGGESSEVRYPGPNVLEAAKQLTAARLPLCLGGVTIPSRLNEADRIQRKNTAGLVFFTTQVLFDSNDIVWLIQRLNGLEARIFLSFAPVSHPRDVEFLRWLGADIPADLDRFLFKGAMGEDGSQGNSGSHFQRSLDLAQRILLDVFDNLPPDPPALGLNIEHINRRNFAAAGKMLERLGSLYSNLVAARSRV